MFKISAMYINSGRDRQEYLFSANTLVYGPNTVGKTAMVHLIDFGLGRSEGLTYDGLDNIESVEMLLTNSKTTLWIKRTLADEYYYKRTDDSEYTVVTAEVYKNNICNIMNTTMNTHMLEVYRTVFDELPSFRTFSFINFLDEKGGGDLTTIFTRAKEPKHIYRIRNIMDFLFNYENIEKIYEKELELSEIGRQLSKLNADFSIYMSYRDKVRKIFKKLDLKYVDDIIEDKKTYMEFRRDFERKPKSNSKDIVYLAKASFDLAEEIKLYSYIHSQTNNTVTRNARIEKLLSLFKMIVDENPEYREYVTVINDKLEEIKREQIIFSVTDYTASVQNLKREKQKIDELLEELKSKASQLDYEETEKMLTILDNCFEVLEAECDFSQKQQLENTQKQIKTEIKNLRNSFNRANVDYFNQVINEIYLNNNLDIKHLNEDRNTKGFKIMMDPMRLALYMQRRNEEDVLETYDPGSLARQTHIQIAVYLGLIKYIKTKFEGLIYMPLLVIDSADQSMTFETGRLLYQDILKWAEELEIQTIFLSKEQLISAEDKNCINISGGLNKFHK